MSTAILNMIIFNELSFLVNQRFFLLFLFFIEYLNLYYLLFFAIIGFYSLNFSAAYLNNLHNVFFNQNLFVLFLIMNSVLHDYISFNYFNYLYVSFSFLNHVYFLVFLLDIFLLIFTLWNYLLQTNFFLLYYYIISC
jgi:hypothetical protein